MKVLWQNVHYPDITLGGGGARNSRHITAAMRKLGHSVTFISETKVPGETGSKIVHGAEVLYYLRPQLPERLWIIRGIRNCFGYPQAIAGYAPGHDAYFCNDPEIVFALKKHGRGKPVVCRVEGTRAGDRASWSSAAETSLKTKVFNKILRAEDDWISKVAWRRCDALLVKSNMIRDELVDWYGMPKSKIAVIPNGVDYQGFAHAEPDEQVRRELGDSPAQEIRIGFVGRLSKVKNLEFLLRSFALVKSQNPCRLVVVGEGEERESLERLAGELGIRERTLFVGHKDNVAPYLAACHIFALPSLYETIANCLLEAMSAGLACVVLRPGANNVRTSSDEVIFEDKTGFLTEGDDPAHMAQAITRLVDDAALRERVGHAAQEEIERRFSWESCAQQYIDLASACAGS